MRTNVKATNLELTQPIADYLNERMGAIEKVMDPNDESVILDVELAKVTKHHRQGQVFKAEINLHTAGHDFYTQAIEEDLYAAIDLVKDDVVREVKSARAKEIALLRRGGRKIKEMLRRLRPWKKK